MPMGFSQMFRQGPRCAEDQFKAALLEDLLFSLSDDELVVCSF